MFVLSIIDIASHMPLLLTENRIAATTGAEDMDKIKANTNNVVISLAHFAILDDELASLFEDKKRKDS
jgi:hypothetical protein